MLEERTGQHREQTVSKNWLRGPRPHPPLPVLDRERKPAAPPNHETPFRCPTLLSELSSPGEESHARAAHDVPGGDKIESFRKRERGRYDGQADRRDEQSTKIDNHEKPKEIERRVHIRQKHRAAPISPAGRSAETSAAMQRFDLRRAHGHIEGSHPPRKGYPAASTSKTI